MKQNYKIKILILFCFVFGFLSLTGFIAPVKVYADTPLGGQCASNTDCATGLFCDTSNGSTCEAVVPGTTPCITNNDCGTSKTGLTCINSKCDVPTATAPATTQSNNCQTYNLTGQTCCNSYPNDPVCTSFQSGQTTATQGTCPAGLTSVNGLCLPSQAPFGTTGLAGSTSLSALLVYIIQILLTFAGVLAVLMLVVGGYWYMAAGGNEEMAEKGKKTIINFVLGLVIIIMAYTLVAILSGALTGKTGFPNL